MRCLPCCLDTSSVALLSERHSRQQKIRQTLTCFGRRRSLAGSQCLRGFERFILAKGFELTPTCLDSAREQALCLASPRTDEPQHPFIYVNIDDAGTLHVSTAARGRVNVAREILTQTPSEPPARRQTRRASAAAQATSRPSSLAQEEEEEIPRFVVEMYGQTLLFTKTELDRRIRSLELWQSHLEVLRYHEERKYAAVKLYFSDNATLERSAAHIDLVEICAGIAKMLPSLCTAVSAESEKGALKLELSSLYDEMQIDELDRVRETRARVEMSPLGPHDNYQSKSGRIANSSSQLRSDPLGQSAWTASHAGHAAQPDLAEEEVSI